MVVDTRTRRIVGRLPCFVRNVVERSAGHEDPWVLLRDLCARARRLARRRVDIPPAARVARAFGGVGAANCEREAVHAAAGGSGAPRWGVRCVSSSAWSSALTCCPALGAAVRSSAFAVAATAHHLSRAVLAHSSSDAACLHASHNAGLAVARRCQRQEAKMMSSLRGQCVA